MYYIYKETRVGYCCCALVVRLVTCYSRFNTATTGLRTERQNTERCEHISIEYTMCRRFTHWEINPDGHRVRELELWTLHCDATRPHWLRCIIVQCAEDVGRCTTRHPEIGVTVDVRPPRNRPRAPGALDASVFSNPNPRNRIHPHKCTLLAHTARRNIRIQVLVVAYEYRISKYRRKLIILLVNKGSFAYVEKIEILVSEYLTLRSHTG